MARRRQFAGSAARRRTSWELGPEETGGQSFSANATATWSGAAQALSEGLTLARIRGVVDIWVQSVTGVNDSFRGAHGICIVNADANTAGGIPDPLTEEAWDGWIWHGYFNTFCASSTDVAGWYGSRIYIDNKAMRKFNETDVLVGVTEVVEVDDGSSLILAASTRTLVLLP